MQKDLIDFVILWVDGNDPEWKKEKEKYAQKQFSYNDSRACRYRDWDNLQYWFRSVEKFAPWVNKIYFVTWGHVPKWLNLNSDKLCIVKHEDFMPKEYLPTFNSNAIELNLHRIKGLSEHFVLFNDDTFLMRPMQPENFFKAGVPVLWGNLVPLQTVEDDTYPYILLNDMILINRHFSPRNMDRQSRKKYVLSVNNVGIKRSAINYLHLKRYGYFTMFEGDHCPVPILKSTMEKLWSIEEMELDKTSGHQFRNNGDVSQYIFRYWQLASGQFIPKKKAYHGKTYKLLSADRHIMIKAIENQKYPMLCLNDTSDKATAKQIEDVKQNINYAFSKILPDKSSFEK